MNRKNKLAQITQQLGNRRNGAKTKTNLLANRFEFIFQEFFRVRNSRFIHIQILDTIKKFQIEFQNEFLVKSRKIFLCIYASIFVLNAKFSKKINNKTLRKLSRREFTGKA